MISIFLNDSTGTNTRQYKVHPENYEFVLIEGLRLVIHNKDELPTMVAKYDPQDKVWKALDGEIFDTIEIRGEPYGKKKT